MSRDKRARNQDNDGWRRSGDARPLCKDPHDVYARARENSQNGDWHDTARHLEVLPKELSGPWMVAADEVAFALGQLKDNDEAACLTRRCYEAEPTGRRASSMAYLSYDSLWQDKNARGNDKLANEQRNDLRRDFRMWVDRALEHEPDSIRDYYRIGVFEAQLENQHDAQALQAFCQAVAIYRGFSNEEQDRQHWLRKPYIKSLYSGARSALRLGRNVQAQQMVFDCIREDGERDFVEPVHKLHLGAKTCEARGQLEHAERGFIKALDAQGQPAPQARFYIIEALSKLCIAGGRHDEAIGWIEERISHHRRKPSQWRLIGIAQVALGRHSTALMTFRNALQKDNFGRHLTNVEIGKVHLSQGDLGKAKRAFEQALEFRERKYGSKDKAALEGLRDVERIEAENGAGPSDVNDGRQAQPMGLRRADGAVPCKATDGEKVSVVDGE